MNRINFLKNKYFYVAITSLFLGLINLSASALLVYAQIGTTFVKTPKYKFDNFEKLIDNIDTKNVNYFSFSARTALKEAENLTLNKKQKQINEQEKAVLPVKIIIRKLGKNLPVKNPNTTNIEALNKMLLTAVLRYPGTAKLNDEFGNMLIFGHSSHLPQHKIIHKMYTAFNDIEKLRYDDRIEVVGEDGAKYIYRVRKVYKVKASKAQIYIKTNKKMLTLITCDNFGAKEDRWIVEAEFIAKF